MEFYYTLGEQKEPIKFENKVKEQEKEHVQLPVAAKRDLAEDIQEEWVQRKYPR